MPRPFLSYFPMVWGFDLVALTLDHDQILVRGKVPVLEEDFQRGRDLYSCYLLSVKTAFGQKSSGRTSPHVIFANATTDQELLDFVREYGPIAPVEVKEIKPEDSVQCIADSRNERWATEDISSLRRERKIYAAALGLMNELQRGEGASNVMALRSYISEIVLGAAAWPSQWEIEDKWRAANCPFPIAWKFDSNRCDRLWNLKYAANWEPNGGDRYRAPSKALHMSPFAAGEMVLCELINAFHSEVQCFNDRAIESLPVNAVSFGVRPCLYLILRREFLSGGGAAICRNDRCKRFFVSGRSGQVFCCTDCSMKHRQRKYWTTKGRKRRKRRRTEAARRRERP